jgi:hypothetical protein
LVEQPNLPFIGPVLVLPVFAPEGDDANDAASFEPYNPFCN